MPGPSDSENGKECASRRFCSPSVSIASLPITVLSDGGDDISHACKLPAATARVLDWFRIGFSHDIVHAFDLEAALRRKI